MESKPDPEFARQTHIGYILALNAYKKTDLAFWMTEQLRVSGYYWGLTALDLLGALPAGEERDRVVSFVVSCFHSPSGGFGGNVGHDPHMLYTLSAVQVLILYDALDRIDAAAVVRFVAARQQPDGSFVGDEWGEVDTRFSYIALACCSLLGRLDAVNVPLAVEFILRCRNFDGGFGALPGAESHAGQVFCCVGALAIAGALDKIDADLLGWWLCERQCKDGGLNGRPEKLADVCYSWWVLSSLIIVDRLNWIDVDGLRRFILQCQDLVGGGFADKPGNMVDVFHTFFGIAGLRFLGDSSIGAIDPVYALPTASLRRTRAQPWTTASQ